MSAAAKAWESRWPHFSPPEVLSPIGLSHFEKSGRVYVQPPAMDKLCDLRERVGRIMVNNDRLRLRGLRMPEENLSIKGSAKYSYHMFGLAFDCTPLDMSLYTFYHLCRDFGWGGVGFYPKLNFVHVDLRPQLLGDVTTWVG